MSILDNPQITQPQKQESIFGLDGSPKTMFILGLASGIGAMALVALIFILAILLNGTAINFGKVTGTQNIVANNPAAGNDQLPTDTNPTTPPAGPVPEVTQADHIKGNQNAKVTLIEYSDFECPFCQRHEATIEQALKDFPNDVRVVYRHFPLTSIHPFAQKAAEASECAARQGKFWEMHQQLFALSETGTGFSLEAMKKAAGDLKLNTNDFNKCLDNGETKNIVDQQAQEGMVAGVEGTPANFVNGQLVSGAVPYATLKQALQAAGAAN